MKLTPPVLTHIERYARDQRANRRTLEQIAADLGVTKQSVSETLDRADEKLAALRRMVGEIVVQLHQGVPPKRVVDWLAGMSDPSTSERPRRVARRR